MRLPFAVDSLACARGAIMLIPSYTAAALTGEMVWTTPTLAGASALAANLKRPADPMMVDSRAAPTRARQRPTVMLARNWEERAQIVAHLLAWSASNTKCRRVLRD